ncbi:hypothetical protein AWENTII_009203 [Aspergillus wentii]
MELTDPHQGSSHDSKRAQNQRQSFYLVICGATSYTDGVMFSDFIGYCMALLEHGVEGDFLSCFPLEQHFTWLQNENNPPVDEIRFGRLEDEDKAVYTYSRDSYVNGQYWWIQVPPSELMGQVQSWIQEKQQQAEAGDTVNLLRECPANDKVEYCIRDRHISNSAFCDLLSGFKDEVQVNAITGVCYSDRFTGVIQSSDRQSRYHSVSSPDDDFRCVSNRIRCSRSAFVSVQLLVKIELPGVSSQTHQMAHA